MSDEEKLARAICVASGIDPDGQYQVRAPSSKKIAQFTTQLDFGEVADPAWTAFVGNAKVQIAIHDFLKERDARE